MLRTTCWAHASLVCLLALAPSTGASANGGPLVYLQQLRPVRITPQSVGVPADGDGAAIVVLGETTIPRPVRFTRRATGGP